MTTLLVGIDVALKIQKQRNSRTTPLSRARETAKTSRAGTLPPVLVVVSDEAHEKHVVSLLSRIIAVGQLSLRVVHDWGNGDLDNSAQDIDI